MTSDGILPAAGTCSVGGAAGIVKFVGADSVVGIVLGSAFVWVEDPGSVAITAEGFVGEEADWVVSVRVLLVVEAIIEEMVVLDMSTSSRKISGVRGYGAKHSRLHFRIRTQFLLGLIFGSQSHGVAGYRDGAIPYINRSADP